VAENLPRDWSMRVLLGLEALSYLSNGAVTVTPDSLDVLGNTGRKSAGTELSQLLSDKLGEAGRFTLDVSYKAALDPVAQLPTPEQCEARIAEVQNDRKIGFEPGSARIDSQGSAIMDEIAEILKECGELKMEIGGHTDSQGREEMNRQLSLERARAVLNELRLRRVLTSTIEAKGYGESEPIADNDTEEGREINRRIEFKVIRPAPVVEEQTALESLEDTGEEGQETDAPNQDPTPDEQN
jgi:OOP family OmpA-OmpF porin